MLELICFVFVAVSFPQDFSDVIQAIDQREKQLGNITADITKTTTSSNKEPKTVSYSVRKKGDFLAVETDDGKVYVFGPQHSFALQRSSNNQYILVGSVVSNLRPMEVEDRTKLGQTERQLMAWFSQGRIPISFTLPWLLLGVEQDLYDTEGPESDGNPPGHVSFVLRQKNATNESEGIITTQHVFDSTHQFRPVSSISNREKSDMVNKQTWEYQDPVNYRYTNEVTYEGGWAKDDYTVSISDATWKDSDFTLAYYGISAQPATGIKPSWWLICIGVFLIAIVLAVKIRQRARHA